MKTKTFLLVCFFIGLGIGQLAAQNNQNQTGSFSERIEGFSFAVPVYCDGVMVDLIDNFDLDFHHVGHWQKGVWIWCKAKEVGTATGESGEIFSVRFEGVQDNLLCTATMHFNLMGNRGSHYIVRIMWDWSSGEVITTPLSAVCPSNNK